MNAVAVPGVRSSNYVVKGVQTILNVSNLNISKNLFIYNKNVNIVLVLLLVILFETYCILKLKCTAYH